MDDPKEEALVRGIIPFADVQMDHPILCKIPHDYLIRELTGKENGDFEVVCDIEVGTAIDPLDLRHDTSVVVAILFKEGEGMETRGLLMTEDHARILARALLIAADLK